MRVPEKEHLFPERCLATIFISENLYFICGSDIEIIHSLHDKKERYASTDSPAMH
jgi:hypothetical protein